jgi:4-hydroxy-tetrahydrodipicolinate synthase
LRRHIDWVIEEGSHGIVPVGTTGESPTLSHDEHKRVVEIAVEHANGRVPVIAGTGSNSTIEAIDFTRHAEQAGADAALVVVPYYNKPTQDGLYAHFKAVAESVSLAILIYNVPSRTVTNISVETLDRLAKDCPNIIGTKDATADLTRPSQQRLVTGERFIQLSGEDATALGFNAHGGTGCISVTANVAPRLCAEFQEATLRGDYAAALRHPGSLDAAPHRAVHRDLSGAGQIRREPARPLPARRAAASGGAERGHPPAGARGDGARRSLN